MPLGRARSKSKGSQGMRNKLLASKMGTRTQVGGNVAGPGVGTGGGGGVDEGANDSNARMKAGADASAGSGSTRTAEGASATSALTSPRSARTDALLAVEHTQQLPTRVIAAAFSLPVVSMFGGPWRRLAVRARDGQRIGRNVELAARVARHRCPPRGRPAILTASLRAGSGSLEPLNGEPALDAAGPVAGRLRGPGSTQHCCLTRY